MEKLNTDRQGTVNFTAKEGSMKEEADLHILFAVAKLTAQNFRQQHQTVVMHLDRFTVLYLVSHNLFKKMVSAFLCLPGGHFKRFFTRVVIR